ncbi:hypothetical protein GGX14DRAFT_451618 [Mycena pura]|uniref:J domain-containing protein n=1 Tax=Mycena pura TaxID=153505 RepID=A0AAD6VH23_9AGAR|nr:hypothetical protein GGX14DRAFT_451618 [Mycena pura]
MLRPFGFRQLYKPVPHVKHASNKALFPALFPAHPNPTPHQIFRLPRNASPADIKARYLDLVRIYHPDKCDSSVPSEVAHARFRAITAAYNTLRHGSTLPEQDTTKPVTPTARAMYKRKRNLYSGPQLADDSWKDKIIVVGVIFAAFCFVIQSAATRRALLLEDATVRLAENGPSEDARLAEEVAI